MKILLRMVGPSSDEGAHYLTETVVRVSTDEEAGLAGQEFARLTHSLTKGSADYQQAIYAAPADGEPDS